MRNQSTTWRIGLIAVTVILLAHLLDGWSYTNLGRPDVYERDLGRLFRIVGYLPLWFFLAAALWLQDRGRRRALLLGLVPMFGGLVAEVLKIFLRRERPRLHEGAYYFRPFADQFWYTRDIGLPSSHAMVAFSAAWLLCRFWPKAWPVWLFLAGGCALTRVQARAHFLSDVVVGAVAAYLLVAWVWTRWPAESLD